MSTTLYDLITIIITNIYTPLVSALNELPLLAQSIDNGVFIFTWSTLIATLLTVFLFFLFAYIPIFCVKWLRGVIR